MKVAVMCSVLILLCTTSMPIIFIKNDDTAAAVAKVVNISKSDSSEKADNTVFKIKMSKTGEIKTVKSEDYIIGVLCGEISPTYSTEAIKAQAVAAYTFALNRSEKAKKENRDYDLTDSVKTDQCYIDKETMKEKWGDNYEKYIKIYKDAVKSVSGQKVTFDGAPALTVYHACSSGVTNSSKDVWGSDLPYLTSVDSMGDRLSQGYLSEVSFSESDLQKALKEKCNVTLGENAFSDMDIAKSGRVLSVQIGKDTLKGGDVATLLSLKSGNFEVSYKGGVYTFTVRGRGHGVGMSQEGAEYMAKQGSTYKEILLHYYKECKIK